MYVGRGASSVGHPGGAAPLTRLTACHPWAAFLPAGAVDRHLLPSWKVKREGKKRAHLTPSNRSPGPSKIDLRFVVCGVNAVAAELSARGFLQQPSTSKQVQPWRIRLISAGAPAMLSHAAPR
ncbi:hypothetical protein DPSP01_006676 [Paraphaeosphaeria sporulosa]